MSFAEDNGYDGYDIEDIGWVRNNDIWVMKGGEEIYISDMEDKHLYYAYRKFNDGRLLREIVLRLFAKSAEVLK